MADSTDLDLPDLNRGQGAAGPEDSASTDLPAQSLVDEAVRTAVDLAPVYDVPVNISAVLGKTHIDVNSLLKLTSGSVLELDRKVGEAIDIYVNNRLVARGEVVVVDDRLGVTMTEIIKDGDSA
ncbi:MAG TPA: flagellar motor switch protein FliN [Oceanicaulis sp.]|jgi:flagellar motor switch protein FliN/FliY|uniref:Flagellar motor switch protein FliN n=1 Tax=Glycocaulis albus TaxID=1382801 RepID=A0ABQ1XWU7_9PROT|nr:flagellar motor switch protein FliN [Glycocaulis albus]MBV5259290.1 flagellar motor switch protein FliN [Synechococcus moorigangaii CMS01]GGH05801.1 flagellar motor switch protein FliN [Glycocaulis albus]HCY56579.1 flagellar motor switch protein FliN [Oceanicaulis sp.]